MTVLILSSLQDVHARAVIEALAARGDVHTELLDLGDFPQHIMLSIAFDKEARRLELRRPGQRPLDLAAITSVWWHRPQAFRMPPSIANETHLRYAWSEATTAFHGLYQSMDALWVNSPVPDAAAAHKPWQLTVAQQCGFDIPPTLMTTDPDDARAFWLKHDQVIYKQFLALPEAWRETRLLTEADAEMAEAIRLAPVIFQRYIPAICDLRVIAIGDDLFAASACAEESTYPQDVRFNLKARYVAHNLPDDVANNIRKLMAAMDLKYGAIDLRLTPEGRYVFFEVNPGGQFLYIEKATGQPIAATFAAYLAQAETRATSSVEQTTTMLSPTSRTDHSAINA
jgi:glutathione synthase/RimK-type ligase-like ATP-grasp enzyme